MHWIREDLALKTDEVLQVEARIRYRQPLQKAILHRVDAGLYVEFDAYQSAITEGQFVAWYINDELLGSGVIFMGTHGMTGLQKIFGSRALKVITNSSVPFIITQDKIRQDDRIDDIVVPIDMGKEDKQILTSVIRSAHLFKAKVL